jgi:hypothetical protein
MEDGKKKNQLKQKKFDSFKCPINRFDSFLIVGVRTMGAMRRRGYKRKQKGNSFFPILKRESVFLFFLFVLAICLPFCEHSFPTYDKIPFYRH